MHNTNNSERRWVSQERPQWAIQGHPRQESQSRMMMTNPNRQHYGPAGGPNKWDMDWPSQGMPKGYQHRYRRNEPSNREPLKRPESFTNLDMLGRPDLAFKYSHTDPGRKEKFYGDEEDASIRGTWRRTADARPRNSLYDEYGYLEGAPRQRTTFSEGSIDPYNFNEIYGGVYDDAIFRTVDPNTNQIEKFPMAEGIGSLQEQAAVDPSDWRNILRILEAGGDPGTETQTAGLWQTWQTIKDRIGEDAANDWLASQQPAYVNRGGLMSLRR